MSVVTDIVPDKVPFVEKGYFGDNNTLHNTVE